MTTIWKYEIPITRSYFELKMPIDAHVLSVALQGTTPVLWAVLSPHNPEQKRRFALIMTGQSIEGLNVDDIRSAFVGTFQIGSIVFHLCDLDRAQ